MLYNLSMKDKLEILMNKDKNIEKLTNKIAKLKNHNESEKISAIIKLYAKYFRIGLILDTKEKMYELYYEQFTKDDKVDEAKYNHFYNYCYDDIILYQYNHIKNLFDKLSAKKANISEKQKVFVKKIYDIKEKYKLDESYDYEKLYLDSAERLNITNDIRWFINDITKNYKFNNDYESYLGE